MHTHLQTLMYEHMCIPPINMKTHTHVCGRLSVCAVRLYVRISMCLRMFISMLYLRIHAHIYLPVCFN